MHCVSLMDAILINVLSQTLYKFDLKKNSPIMLASKTVIDHNTNKQINVVIFYCHNSDANLKKDIWTFKRSLLVSCRCTKKLIINLSEEKTNRLNP